MGFSLRLDRQWHWQKTLPPDNPLAEFSDGDTFGGACVRLDVTRGALFRRRVWVISLGLPWRLAEARGWDEDAGTWMPKVPEVGRLAWEPSEFASDMVDRSRHNGTPTLGLVTMRGERWLFWRVSGYGSGDWSVWLYVPVTAADERLPVLLDGVVFGSPADRPAVIALARKNRVTYCDEWTIRANEDADDLLSRLAVMVDLEEEG